MPGLGQFFTHPRPEPAGERHSRAAGAGFQVIIDNTPVNFPASVYRGGMAIPGAFRAAVLISDLMGSLTWCAYRERPRQAAEKIEPTPILLEQPAPPDTRMTTFSSWALDLVWHGNAIGLVAARGPGGWPTAALPIPAEYVGVRRVGWEAASQLPIGSIEYKIGTRSYGSDEVIHIKGPCPPGEIRGLGVLEAHMETLELAHEQQRQASSISHHGVPTGVLKDENPDVTEDELKEMKRGWMQNQRERTVAAIGPTTSFQPLSWNPEELQLVEARKFTLHELALIFGLDPSWLGAAQSSRVYANIEQEGINLLKYSSLRGHITRFEETLSLAFPRRTKVKATTDSILRMDTLARYQAYQIGLGSKFLTVDEVRQAEDRQPMTEPEQPPEPPAPPEPDAEQTTPIEEAPSNVDY